MHPPADNELHRKSPYVSGGNWKATLWLVIGSVAAILALQMWSSSNVLRSAADLRALLSEAHSAANNFERNIGYGGLIHNFKNYVLRPDEDGYRLSAENDASDALALLERLSNSAQSVGIDAPLTKTRGMLRAYTQRLESVQALSASGLPPKLVDAQVRFNDSAALKEVEGLLEMLDTAFYKRISEVQKQGTVTTMLSTAGTALLGLILIGIVTLWQRRQGLQHGELSMVAESLGETNDDLARLNTSLNQFAGIVSHDLKAPVRNIKMMNKLIIEDIEDTAEVRQLSGRIDIQVRQMDSIIDSLLAFTQFGFARPQTEAVEVDSLFADIKRNLPAGTEQSGARLEFTAELEQPVLVDPRLMSRVFSNLISNSLKYVRADEPANISVNAQSDGKRAQISVSDNGIGIEARFAEKIFEPMARLHGPQSEYKGVGIGLSLVKTIIESHGGAIWLDTEYTQGTRIVFSLPLGQSVELQEAA